MPYFFTGIVLVKFLAYGVLFYLLFKKDNT